MKLESRQAKDAERRKEMLEAREKRENQDRDRKLTPVQERVRDKVLQGVPERIGQLIRTALSEAGVADKDVDNLAHDVMVCSMPSTNQNEQEMKRELRAIINPATDSERLMSKTGYSRRLVELDVSRYVDVMHEGMNANYAAALKQFPPDSKDRILIVDGHEKNYSTAPAPEGTAIHSSRRRYHSQKAIRDNAHYDWCTYYLGGLMLWFHNERPIVVPVMLHHPWPGIQQNPRAHAKLILNVVRGLSIKPSAIVLDSYYDGQDFRDTIHAAGHVCVVRMTVGPNTDRHITLKDGTDTTICDIVQELVDDPEAEIRAYTERLPDGSTEAIHAKRRIIEGTLGKKGTKARDQRTTKLLIRVRLKPGLHGPEIMWGSLLVAIMDGPREAWVLKFLYNWRWRIEVLYHQLALNETAGREQTINTEHVQFMTSLLLVANALLILFVMAFVSPTGWFGPINLSRLSVKATLEVLLEGT